MSVTDLNFTIPIVGSPKHEGEYSLLPWLNVIVP